MCAFKVIELTPKKMTENTLCVLFCSVNKFHKYTYTHHYHVFFNQHVLTSLSYLDVYNHDGEVRNSSLFISQCP